MTTGLSAYLCTPTNIFPLVHIDTNVLRIVLFNYCMLNTRTGWLHEELGADIIDLIICTFILVYAEMVASWSPVYCNLTKARFIRRILVASNQFKHWKIR